MEAIRLQRVIEKDGEILVTGLPYKKGQAVELILLTLPQVPEQPEHSTARHLLQSGLVGIWQDRNDIEDSAAFARRLRDEAYHRWK